MARHKHTRWCDGCGVEILGAPLIRDSRDHCCEDCLNGSLCACGELPQAAWDERRAGPASRGDAALLGVLGYVSEAG